VTTEKTNKREAKTLMTEEFRVDCDAGKAGSLHLATSSLSVAIGQRVQIEGSESPQIWSSVLVACREAGDGSLEVQITLFHPEWDEGRQIALIKSRPNNKGPDTPTLNVNLAERSEVRG
jgi:hypothetical protein